MNDNNTIEATTEAAIEDEIQEELATPEEEVVVEEPEPQIVRKHDTKDYKSIVSLWVAIGCLIALIALSIVSIWCVMPAPIDRTMEIIKAVALICLGFFFGRRNK